MVFNVYSNGISGRNAKFERVSMSKRLPTYFISHGGGPWPWMADRRKMFAKLEQSFLDMVEELDEKPKAVLMISGHWEESTATIMSSPNPPMVYDYFNFPPETYEVVYPAPGSPDFAAKTLSLLQNADIEVSLDKTRGFDHGTFVPMHIMYPQADVPLFQLSLLSSYEPEKHIAIGRALAPLRDEGVLVIGSGLSYHNLRMLGPEAAEPSDAFDKWLEQALALPPEQRTRAIIDWESAPYARVCHAKEDHLAPLFVALGAAEADVATQTYHERGVLGGMTASSYRFG